MNQSPLFGPKGMDDDDAPTPTLPTETLLKLTQEIAHEDDGGDAASVAAAEVAKLQKRHRDSLMLAPQAAARKAKHPRHEYARLVIQEPVQDRSREEISSCKAFSLAMQLRSRYIGHYEEGAQFSDLKPSPKALYDAFNCPIPSGTQETIDFQAGVAHVYKDAEKQQEICKIPTLSEFITDYHKILEIVADGPCNTLAYRRLEILDSKFQLHLLLNAERETAEQKSSPHRDFYNVRKVDNHVHHSSCMNQKHLLRFIKKKLKTCGSEVVIFRDNQYLTLEQVFQSLNLTAEDLSVDMLDMHAHDTFQRFDKFNLKYNPCGQSRLREIFLKTENYVKGRYMAEITKEVMSDLESSKYQMAEYRISIYGRNKDEWSKLAAWFCENQIYSDNVRWLIQVPRLYNVHKETGAIKNFEEFMANVFEPLFQVTRDPSSCPNLHRMLQQIVGFDSVDDESKPERQLHKAIPAADKWDHEENPPYGYYTYYMYTNILSLNKYRSMKGMNTFSYRPHSGEAGDISHLAVSFLTADAINHGIMLNRSPVLQYLYYLTQIGVSTSPLSNNSLFLDYNKNPFPKFFNRGLNMTLSTDDPLQFHMSREPLIEEFSIAAQVWKLKSCDVCEIARNSVLQSGFEPYVKAYWLGEKYYAQGPEANGMFAHRYVPRKTTRDWNMHHSRLYIAALEDHSRLVGL
eukprot:TRINITY_DN1391_c0_g3_i6.p1 TRINITY_DN1391_c0_g3~~TRINITY_DN1391_c0_g3_i6.p1  ORF type:complete len:686 (+),score=142.14 TRINITY_DN1391_c0_g3_i6:82-2139(+)